MSIINRLFPPLVERENLIDGYVISGYEVRQSSFLQRDRGENSRKTLLFKTQSIPPVGSNMFLDIKTLVHFDRSEIFNTEKEAKDFLRSKLALALERLG